jgi:hypothetical protein
MEGREESNAIEGTRHPNDGLQKVIAGHAGVGARCYLEYDELVAAGRGLRDHGRIMAEPMEADHVTYITSAL